MLLCSLLASCLLAASADTHSEQLQKTLAAKLQPLLDYQAKAYDSGVVLAFRSGDTKIELASGYAARKYNATAPRELIKTTDPLMWGSITKMYTGAGIMQLRDKGVLKLSDLAAKHVDPILKRLNSTSMVELFGPNASAVTIEHLLGMQSGIYDFDDDDTRAYCNAHPKIDVTPFDDIAFASQRGHKKSLYYPGTDQDYSSTNFELLGLILAHYANASNWDTYDQRSIFPAAVRSEFPKSRFALHGPCSDFSPVHGYEPDDSYGFGFDTYFMSCTNGYTCGNIATTAEEVNDYVWKLYGPDKSIVSAESAALMGTIKRWYGLATMSLPGYQKGKQFCRVGHLGVTYGFTGGASYNSELNFAMTWGTGQEDPGQTRTHGVHYDFLMYFDCLVYSVAVEVMTNGTSPASAVNCTLRCHDSFACNP